MRPRLQNKTKNWVNLWVICPKNGLDKPVPFPTARRYFVTCLSLRFWTISVLWANKSYSWIQLLTIFHFNLFLPPGGSAALHLAHETSCSLFLPQACLLIVIHIPMKRYSHPHVLATSTSVPGSYNAREYSKLRDNIPATWSKLSRSSGWGLVFAEMHECFCILDLFHIVVEAGLGVRLLSIYLILFTFGKWFPMLMRFQSQLASSHIMVCWDSDAGLLGFTLVGTLCACIALCLSSFSLYLSITAQCSRKFHLLKHIPRSTVVCNMALITDLFLFLAAL